MKKIFITLVVAFLCMGTSAQTNFRKVTFNEGIAAAKAEGKPLFVDFFTTWCGPCKMMARTVFPDKQFGKFMNDHFVCLQIDAEKGEGPSLAKTYKVGAYPTFVIINNNSKAAIATFVGGRETLAFQGELERALNPERSENNVVTQYNAGNRSAQVVKDYLGYLTSKIYDTRFTSEEEYMAKLRSIDQIANDYYTSLPDTKKALHENMFIYTNYTKDITSPEGLFMLNHKNEFTGGDKDMIDSTLNKLVKIQTASIFSGSSPYSETSIDLLKKTSKQMGLDKELDTVFEFIAAGAKGDAKEYINFCNKNFDKLSPSMKETLTCSYSDHFKNASPEIKKEAAQFLRQHLSNLSYGGIDFTALQIGELERGNEN